MQLFRVALEQRGRQAAPNGIRLRVVGDLEPSSRACAALIEEAERMTAGNTRLTLTIAANYGGRWDILQAVNRAVARAAGRRRGPHRGAISRRIWR